MLQKFEAFVKKNRLFNKKSRLLLALSGGEDSVCLFHLIKEGGYDFSVAHCNFGLRNTESDGDEKFVRNLAEKHGVECHVIAFETKKESEKLGMNIQEAARKLRYDWFQSLCVTHGFDTVLTAHHMDDNTETMLINLIRGTGISGLHGIRASRDNIRRPLLCFQKSEISEYISANGHKFRLDSSNLKDDYTRNQLRHRLIPELVKIDRKANLAFFNTALHINEFEKMARGLLTEKWKDLVNFVDGSTEYLSFEKLNGIDPEFREAFLYETLKCKGFTRDQTDKLQGSEKARTGFHLLSSSHEIIKERDGLIIRPLQIGAQDEFEIDKLPCLITIGAMTYKAELTGNDAINLKVKQGLHLDYKGLKFPLKLRCWRKGDKMVPLGMKGNKKVSDILTDKKVPNSTRKKVLVLVDSNGELLAILPDMPSDVHKVRHNTSEVLRLRII